MRDMPYRITLTSNSFGWHWLVEYESHGHWYRLPLYECAEGWRLTRDWAERAARGWIRRYIAGWERYEARQVVRIEVPSDTSAKL
jgi:hypothetical protein